MFDSSNYTRYIYTWSSIHLLTNVIWTEYLALFFISALFLFIFSSLFFFSSTSHSSYFFCCLFFLISGNFCFSIYFGSGLFILATGWLDYFSYMKGSLRLSDSLASSFLSVMLCCGSSSFFLCYILISLSLRSNSSWSMELSILLWRSATLVVVKLWVTFYFLTLRVVCKVLI